MARIPDDLLRACDIQAEVFAIAVVALDLLRSWVPVDVLPVVVLRPPWPVLNEVIYSLYAGER